MKLHNHDNKYSGPDSSRIISECKLQALPKCLINTLREKSRIMHLAEPKSFTIVVSTILLLRTPSSLKLSGTLDSPIQLSGTLDPFHLNLLVLRTLLFSNFLVLWTSPLKSFWYCRPSPISTPLVQRTPLSTFLILHTPLSTFLVSWVTLISIFLVLRTPSSLSFSGTADQPLLNISGMADSAFNLLGTAGLLSFQYFWYRGPLFSQTVWYNGPPA